MTDVLLTVSGEINPEIYQQCASGSRPQADYMEMANRLGAEVLDYTLARQLAGWFGRFVERLGGPNLVLAWACFRQRGRYAVIFTDGEQVGIPLAWLYRVAGQRKQHHVMIAHILSVRKKMIFFDLFRLASQVDIFFVYSTWQKRFIQERWHLSDTRVIFTPFMVDTEFFSPQKVTPVHKPMICAVGLEFRDYLTLIRAVRRMEIDLVIAAASPWSKRKDTTRAEEIPANVSVNKFSLYELRQLYADCLFVVVPLFDVNFQAGVTTILEAMAMEKAVICTRTDGQTDVIVDGVTGLYVTPEDPDALRAAIEYLLSNPDIAEAMGKAGRRRVVEDMNLDCYVERLHHHVRALTSE